MTFLDLMSFALSFQEGMNITQNFEVQKNYNLISPKEMDIISISINLSIFCFCFVLVRTRQPFTTTQSQYQLVKCSHRLVTRFNVFDVL